MPRDLAILQLLNKTPRPYFRVVFLTRFAERAIHILWLARECARNPDRHLCCTGTQSAFLSEQDALRQPLFNDHHGGWQCLVNLYPTAAWRLDPVRLSPPVLSLDDLLDGTLGKISPSQKDSLTIISRSMTALVELTNLLLAVSRIELGRLTMNKQRLDLNRFFREVVSVAIPLANEKHVTFVQSIPELPTAFLDPRLTRMVVENILSNAVKYTPTGGTVDLTVDRQGDQIVIRVSDTGIGIPQSDQSKVFAKQYRASNTGDIDGNGFGLYVAKRAVEQQSGRIVFASDEGHGTVFSVHLPL